MRVGRHLCFSPQDELSVPWTFGKDCGLEYFLWSIKKPKFSEVLVDCKVLLFCFDNCDGSWKVLEHMFSFCNLNCIEKSFFFSFI